MDYLNSERISIFVENAKYKFTNASSRCIDGRYSGDNDLPAMAKPGADEGDLATLLAALNKLEMNVNYEEALDSVIESVGGVENFQFHTDDHAEQSLNKAGMGCGHVKFECSDPENYGLTKEQGNYIHDSLQVLLQQGAKQEVLHGNHEEQAVLIIESENYSLKSHILQPSDMECFVYHKTLTEKRMANLSHNFYIKHAKLNFSESQLYQAVLTTHYLQLNQTVEKLAANLPKFLIHINRYGAHTTELV